ncbi:TPA: acyl carrier protein [Campylobacter coli]|uniref:acyl carrier protein n=1 Tax=Campylobacter coli TaxID=195 RepID=UPI000931D8C4|nr:acyl carrier protein [Campylobacter coli]HEB7537117.1 acyl carrier protein [Campylobacter coli]HEB7551253.1 acyl carrier protein [Campylobacter coli]
MIEVKKLFENIGRNDIDENMQNLIEDGIIDSLDILNLVNEIEKCYEKELDFDFMEASNFENFESIREMIKKAFEL